MMQPPSKYLYIDARDGFIAVSAKLTADQRVRLQHGFPISVLR